MAPCRTLLRALQAQTACVKGVLVSVYVWLIMLCVLCAKGFDASQGLEEGWLPTLLLLRDYEIPSIFTASRSDTLTHTYTNTHSVLIYYQVRNTLFPI